SLIKRALAPEGSPLSIPSKTLSTTCPAPPLRATFRPNPATFTPGYHQRYAGEQMAEFKLRIDGMHCGSCVRRVSQALAATQGIIVDEVPVGGAKLPASQAPPPVDL